MSVLGFLRDPALVPLMRSARKPSGGSPAVHAGQYDAGWLSQKSYQPFRQPLASYGMSSLWKSRYWPLGALPLLLL